MKSPLRLLIATSLAMLVTVVAHAVSKPVRLYEISAVRFVVDEVGQRWLQRGLLDSLGGFQVQSVSGVLESVTVPPQVLDRTIIALESWLAYDHLGDEAVANFVIDEETGPFLIGLRNYYYVTVSDNPRLDLGDAVNLSTRGLVSGESDPLVGGFVIENQHRWVLIRGVGPGLAPFHVANPVADPYLVVYKNGSQQFQLFNDDWGQRFDADQVEATAALVGAFPLARGSKDAAYLVELPPGGYTVHLSTDGTPGTGLLEIYVVP